MILGKKVQLRPIEREDLPRFVEWFSDPEFRRYLGVNLPFSLAQEERWFEKLLDRMAKQEVLTLTIETVDGAHIGNVSLFDINWQDRHAELGIAIGDKAYWGQGYGTDATRTILRVGFDDFNLHRIFLRVHEDNARAIRCYEKVGFRMEGTLRESVFRDGAYRDMILMSILTTEFDPHG